ncbi:MULTISPECIES: cell division protein ZapE [unclassified Shewanella]|uniref:cell division protein ZapE n=1 Tax=unclassified Shewanella TaxID=196818 RepID=UPI000C83A9AF|nr:MULTISPECIES: cell division protein ZapE [unclassified Shewanella]MDO6619362.1 cell division protein ZapE [Shewanella sp. 6_MG-2023]MDO6679760.1 cell division protein ZapE [Shewanella sp. 4_MG-2023]MDO6776685.1 cell division protein ZapE [Shewanella sp. 3_MG-2023]PMG30641.1 ATPase [Shewanella sp. 10N.286.52.C2]PMG41617.1 ATPase [Shewanella sp. 10N.286.52.B9]
MSQLSPWQHYQQDLTREGFSHDLAQEQAVKSLQRVYEELIAADVQQSSLSRLLGSIGLKKSAPSVKGLYLWGGVGRGKTYLMDTFFDALPTEKKLRAHFHRFMHQLHHDLGELDGVQDPLITIANKMAQQYNIICFDEFFVSDITDAMLLGTLFQHLFKEGVALVATSNIIPDDLYKNGLQRARFLPAIALINQNCEILNVDSGIDYRLRTLEQAEIYHYPLDEQADTNLLSYFAQLAPESEVFTDAIEIEGREVNIRQQSQGVLLANFRDLCDGPRSQRDYMEVARLYHTVLLSGLEQMGSATTGDDIARRFLAMVDEFYERNVKLIISAEVSLEDIYTDGLLSFEFRRCRSRLIEMQSHDYLMLEHLP